jgi:hypothetical protein
MQEEMLTRADEKKRPKHLFLLFFVFASNQQHKEANTTHKNTEFREKMKSRSPGFVVRVLFLCVVWCGVVCGGGVWWWCGDVSDDFFFSKSYKYEDLKKSQRRKNLSEQKSLFENEFSLHLSLLNSI